IADYIINHLISGMGKFVQLFFILSGFSMCCGYYDKIKNNQISLNKFYNRRYEKILPFFAILVLLDLAVSFATEQSIRLDSIIEAFADLTLMFGLYTVQDMSVIGVGWTLGIIFGFYILFPFFVYLIWNKRRAWISLALTLIIYVVSNTYFRTGGTLAFCSMCYFVTGGLIYLYRDKIAKVLSNRVWLGTIFFLIGFVIVFVIPNPYTDLAKSLLDLTKMIVGFSLMVSGALCADTKYLSNQISKFVSGISLEIYLAHMMVFRVLQKVGLTTIAGGNVVSYIIVCIGTISGAVVFAVAYKQIERIVKTKFMQNVI
ncbi:MAG: acyltransferase, partial [Ruminococcus sp.]|nr:acyltransferase [Ruminococcus sp.]